MDQRGRGAGDDDLWALGGAVHSQQHHADALADGELLQAGLLALGHAGLSLAEVEDHVHGLEALDGGGEDLAGAVRVLIEDGVALGLADFLEDDLLGHLRCDASQRRGVLVKAQLSADLDLGGEFAGGLECELVVGVLDEFGGLNDGLVDVCADLAGLLVHLAAHVLHGLVELARGKGDGVFDGADDDLRVNALLAAEDFNRLVECACHVCLLVSAVAGYLIVWCMFKFSFPGASLPVAS